MKVTLTQESLSRALSTVSRIASSRTTLPILNNILIKTENNQLVIAATNLEVSVTEKITAHIDEEGILTAPARLLTEFVSNLPKVNVELVAADDKLTITAGTYHSTINTVAADEFPEIPDISSDNHIAIDTALFKQSVAQTVLVASSDTTRPVLTGVFVHSLEKQLYFAATDGYRLAEKKVMPCDADIAAIIPASTLSDVARIVGDEDEMTITLTEDQVSFSFGNTILQSRLIDGKFIDYRQLIPTKTDIAVTIERAEFVRIVKISELFAREVAGSITLATNEGGGSLEIHSLASEVGENNSSADAEVRGNGTITLNAKFLLDALNQIDSERVQCNFNGKLAPALIVGVGDDTYKHIVMPVRS